MFGGVQIPREWGGAVKRDPFLSLNRKMLPGTGSDVVGAFVVKITAAKRRLVITR